MVYSVEEDGDLPFITVELVPGRTLDRLIPAGGLGLLPFLRPAVQIASAVAAAHRRGIARRDLRPANIVVNDDGVVKVLEFGLAEVFPTEAPCSRYSTDTVTGEGAVTGTVRYMSPERLQGRSPGPRSDVFSLGIIFYEMVTAAHPFRRGAQADLISAILRDEPRPVTELRADLPQAVGRVIRRCLRKDADRRCATAIDLCRELEAIAP